MKRFVWLWLAVSSTLLVSFLPASSLFTSKAEAGTRPLYGGTLHIAMREALMSLDPSDGSQPDSLARRNLLSLIFETLVIIDDQGRIHPGLATEWQVEPGNQRWRFGVRKDVKFHDGSMLTPEIVASSLRSANPSWKVFEENGAVVVERDRPDPDLLAELAMSRNSIAKKNGGNLIGTGPFHIGDWQPGKYLTLGAEGNHWRGRPFVNSIQAEMGRSFHEQLLELESGKADLVEVSPEQGHRVNMEGRRVTSSQPVELLALVFTRDPQTPEEKQLRGALAHCIDRASMRSVLLQGAGVPAVSLLPNWITGYAFTFSPDVNLNSARDERGLVHAAPAWTLGYDANDSVARVIAARVALNARDAALFVEPTTAANADMKLVRIPLTSSDPAVALTALSTTIGSTMPTAKGETVEGLYGAEQQILAEQRVIPLFHLPSEWASSPALRNWQPGADGSWHLDEVWIKLEKPEKETP